MLPRRSLQLAALFVLALIVIGVFSELGVGLSEPPTETGNLHQDLINQFEAAEEEYLLYGRWIDLLVGLTFAAVLAAASFLPGTTRAKYLLVAGAAVAVVGDAIDLSQLVGIDIARFSLENNLAADFTAANVFRIGINTTSTHVWVAGLLLTGMGLLIVSVDADQAAWAKASGSLAVALIAVGLTDLFAPVAVFDVAQWILSLVFLYWVWVATKRSPTGGGASLT